MKADLLFAVWPYVASALLVVGIGVRYLLDRRQMAVVAEEISEARSLFGGNALWRACLLLLLVGHLALLLLPRAILAWNANGLRLYLLEGLFFLLGAIALLKLLSLAQGHLRQKNRSAIIELSDTIFLALLLVGVLSGLLMAVMYRWASTWGAITLTPYVASLVRIRPATSMAAQMPFLVRLHVFSAFTALAIFPLTRLAAFPVLVIHHAFAWIGLPVSAIGRAGESWLRKHNPAPWLWPEED